MSRKVSTDSQEQVDREILSEPETGRDGERGKEVAEQEDETCPAVVFAWHAGRLEVERRGVERSQAW